MSNEYGRIHTDGSRSGGQPVLLPCPFCGGRAEIAEIETEDLPLWLGECLEPPCEAVAPVRPTRDEAIAAWNTRQPTQSDEVRDQLLQECLVKLRDVQGTEAPKQYACNLIKRIERVLQGQSK